jgi:hypothetical protein
VKTVPITCPNCGSADLAERGPSDYRCNHCGSFFLARAGAALPSHPHPPHAPHPPHPPNLPHPPNILSGPRRSSFPLVVLGVLFAMMILGAVASAVLGGRAPPPPPTYEPPINNALEIQPSGVEPRAELGAQIDGTTRIGGRFWLIDYRNVGEVEITNAAVAVSLFDASDTRIAEQSGYATVKRLQPGKSTTILVLINQPPTYQRAQIQIVKPQSSDYGLPEVELSVSDFRETNSVGALRDIIGTVKNPHKRMVRFVNVLVVGRDASDQPVSFATGIPTNNEIEAGGESGFSVNVGTFEVEPPKKWEVTVVGSPL